MLMKVFVLGCSGSGKSTAARYISMLARDKGWFAIHVNDYDIMYEMFLTDSEERFRLIAYKGFDVLDPTVYDTALLKLKEKVQSLQRYTEPDKLIIIEFARADYHEAFKLFSDDFLKDAYFLFIDSNPDICIRRIHERAIHGTTIDDHFVPEYIVRAYRYKDNRSYMTSGLKKDFAISDEQVHIIDNVGSPQEFLEKLERFVNSIVPAPLTV